MSTDETRRLRAALERLERPVYAVLDGAHWTDLPAELARIGLQGRSLFMDAARAVERSGPWLVSLHGRPREREAVLDLVGDRPAAVFWACNTGGQTIWRHLRTINQARVATGAAPPSDDGHGHGHGTPAPGKTLLFRHWDPRVLADVASVLDGGQYARLLGPADEVLFLDGRAWGGTGVKRLVRLPELPAPTRGQLVIDADALAEIDLAARERSQRKVGAYLTRVAPALTEPLGEDGIAEHVGTSRISGEAYGITTERAHMKWAFLMLMTQHRAADMPQVAAAMRSGQHPPDRQVDELMRQVVSAAQARDGRAG